MNYFIKVNREIINHCQAGFWKFQEGNCMSAELTPESVGAFCEFLAKEFRERGAAGYGIVVGDGISFEILPATDAVKVALRITES